MEQEELLLLLLMLVPFWAEQVLVEVLLQKGLMLPLEEVPLMLMMTWWLRRGAFSLTYSWPHLLTTNDASS